MILINSISKDRWKQYQKKKKIKENKINFLKTKFQMTKLEQFSKEEQIESNRLQAVEKNIKAQYTVLRKEEKLKNKLEVIQNETIDNQQEFQIKKRVEIKKEIARQYALNFLLQYLNFESFCQMFEEASERGLQKKKLLFQANNKAKIIQKAIRKRNIIKVINNKLGFKSRKILLSFIFRIRMSIRIKKKKAILRKINLHYLKQSIFLKVRTNLNIMIKATLNIQQFYVKNIIKLFKLYDQLRRIYTIFQFIQVKIERFINCRNTFQIKNKWDEYMKQEFKGLIIDKEKEEQKLNQLQNLNEKQVQIMKQLSYPIRSQKALYKEIQIQKKPKLKMDMIRLNLLKKIPQKIMNEDEQKEKDIKQNYILAEDKNYKFLHVHKNYKLIQQKILQSKSYSNQIQFIIELTNNYLTKQYALML